MRNKTLYSLLMAAVAIVLGSASAQAQLLINGAGATFPYPIYSKWFDQYTHVKPEVRFNYQSIGSGGGIKQLISHTVDFGASDAPMTDEQLKDAGAPVLHFPTVMGAVVVTYNIADFNGTLKLTGPIIADIFMGKITNWKADPIAALNPDIKLPDQNIVVCHRSDGSGTTYVFSDYLSKVSPGWQKDIGKSTAVKWPVGLGGKGNEGVTALVQQTPGGIGYIELIYAVNNKLPYADLQNKDGKWMKASVESVTAAASSTAADMPKDFRVSITDAPGEGSYPLSSFTYLLVYAQQQDAQKGKALVDFMGWMLRDGQKLAPALTYAPLPTEVVSSEVKQLEEIKLP